MPTENTEHQVCVIVGASHAGVNCAFALRRNGWAGKILLFDKDPELPYHRPPLSKSYLSTEEGIENNILKSAESYEQEHITLRLGTFVKSLNRDTKTIILEDGTIQAFDKLVLAVGARAFIPPIKGIENFNLPNGQTGNVFTLRTANDANRIRAAFNEARSERSRTNEKKRIVVIGGGYIGLEVAASLKKLGSDVTVLEREDRILSRVAPPIISEIFQNLHTVDHGVPILKNKDVIAIEHKDDYTEVVCDGGYNYPADIIIIGVGIKVNVDLAKAAGLEIENGIKVNPFCQTSDENIYAIGDCTFHYNPHYNRYIRLESVQNAVDQAKVAAAAICGKEAKYDAIPWFWSDQYDVKLQMVGLSTGFDQYYIRKEEGDQVRFSVWYFKDEKLLAVDAVNNARAYMLGMKLIKSGQKINTQKLIDPNVPLKPTNILMD